MIKNVTFYLAIILVLCSCKEKKIVQPIFNNSDINKVITGITDIMVHDITNPPLAARFFSYACLAGCEIVTQNDSTLKSMYNILNEYPIINKPDLKGYSYQLSALLAMMEVSKNMQPSGSTMMLTFQKQFLDSLIKSGVDENLIDASMQYADNISKHILEYAKADKYGKISNYSLYQPIQKEGYWFPTPPGYLNAVEPYFNTLRSFTLDSATQFKPMPPVAFSSDRNSTFMKQLMLNYKDTLTDDQRAIAAFWDCNPFAIKEQGHLLMSLKKISPGAHWLGITGIVCKKANKKFNNSLFIHTLVSVGLMDAFMSCWDEKYHSNRIRPETAIRKYIDPSWKPLLQTPPFPEYTSGHSVASGAAATLLTHFFGDNFAYIDSVEVSYGLPAKSFSSFHNAAEEAAISRFYGGIHYMDAIENGLDQGKKVGKWVVGKLK